jgi:hypothetical protein
MKPHLNSVSEQVESAHRIGHYALLVYSLILVTYGLRSVIRAVFYREYNPGKDLLVLTTVICWYVGMVVFNSDFAFTVTNVITHMGRGGMA